MLDEDASEESDSCIGRHPEASSEESSAISATGTASMDIGNAL